MERLRAEFPILSRTVHGKPLVYLDNANTTQKPRVVIDADRRYYEEMNANIHRGTHWLSEKATEAYEGARAKVARFLGAASAREVVFTRGTTEAINLVASSFAQAFLKAGDEILITGLEHHSNIVPWQLAVRADGRDARRRADHGRRRGSRRGVREAPDAAGRGSPPCRTSRTRSAPSTRSSDFIEHRACARTSRSSSTARRRRRTSRST